MSTHSLRPNRTSRPLPIALLLFYLTFGAMSIFAQGPTGTPPPPKKSPKTKTEPASTVTASGEVWPVRYIKLTSEVAGRIQQFYVNPGEQVKKNQRLVVIDSSEQAQSAAQQSAINDAEKARDALASAKQAWEPADAAVSQAKKDAATAESDWNTFEREFQRAKSLLEAKVLSPSEYDAARDRVDRARVKLDDRNLALKQASERADQQRAVVNEAQTRAEASAMRTNYLDTLLRGQSNRRGKITLFSPLDCIVADIPTGAGEVVFGGLSATTLMTLADMSAIHVEVYVEETEISRVEVGQQVRIVVDALGEKQIRGLVTGKDPRPDADSNNRSGLSNRVNPPGPKEFKVMVEMREMSDEIRNRLRPGMSATATITAKGRK